MKLKITKIGDSLGVGLTPEILEEMNVGEGDTLYVTQTDNGIYLTPHDPEFKEVMETAQDITQRYSQAMKELAK
ncbi:MAG: AbrB/MazE/SpoVT family DNA-binding domain-containing protein [Cyanobacteria bacterium J06621_12]